MVTKYVEELLQDEKMTVAELADRSGLPLDRTTAIALGRWTPSPAERKQIADVFNLQPIDIAWGHKTPIQHLYGHGPG
jgi:hypothetical protein